MNTVSLVAQASCRSRLFSSHVIAWPQPLKSRQALASATLGLRGWKNTNTYAYTKHVTAPCAARQHGARVLQEPAAVAISSTRQAPKSGVSSLRLLLHALSPLHIPRSNFKSRNTGELTNSKQCWTGALLYWTQWFIYLIQIQPKPFNLGGRAYCFKDLKKLLFCLMQLLLHLPWLPSEDRIAPGDGLTA